MRDYELAEHSPQEYFDLAQRKYKQAVKIIKDLTFYVKNLRDDFSEAVALREFDWILQCILLREAAVDGEFHRLEKQFIDQLTDNADVLALVHNKIGLDIDWDKLEYLEDDLLFKTTSIIKSIVEEYADDFVEEFAKIDAFVREEDYISELVELINGIVVCLACVDGKTYPEELAAGEHELNEILAQKWNLRKHVIRGIVDDKPVLNGARNVSISMEDSLEGVYYNLYRGDRTSFVKFYPSYPGSLEGEFTDVITDITETDDDSDESRNDYEVEDDRVVLKKWYMDEGTEYIIWEDYLVPEEFLSEEEIPDEDFFTVTINDIYKTLMFDENGTVLVIHKNPRDGSRSISTGRYYREDELIKIEEVNEEGRKNEFFYLVYDNRITDSAKIKKSAFNRILSM